MSESKNVARSAQLHLVEKLRGVLERIIGSECWSIIAGDGTGSAIMLDLGKKIPRETEIKNKPLSEEQRKNRGEFVLYVTSVWRLDSTERVICGAWDDNRKGGPMLKGLRRLKGKTVEGFSLDDVGMDLTLVLSGGLCLKIFCDALNEVDQGDNYSLSTQRDSYIVGLRSVLMWEAVRET